ncbi:MAG: CDP-archaeol synthase [Parachlamydiaceae bacterium]|nr:CDP-archaeol synthase [Parachlamydiaceae bacterium]
MILDKMSPLQQRLIISAIGVFMMLIIIYLSPIPAFKPVFTLIIAAVIGVAMWEYYDIAHAKGLIPIKRLGIALASLYAVAVALSTQYPAAKELPEIALLFCLLGCFLYFFGSGSAPFTNLSTTFFGIAYLAIPLSCMIRIAYFFSQSGPQDGRWWLLYLITVTKMTDTGGFFIGKRFGHNKLAPYISPKKTWEGAIGGLCLAVLTSIIITILASIFDNGAFQLNFWQSIWLGIWIGVLAQCGDLAESLLKRDGGVKDSNQLPGLGGMLDITDSLVFTAPLVYIFLKIHAA